MKASKKSRPTWVDVRTKLGEFDRAGLLGLVRDLYAAGKDNQAFMHARLGLGGDVLEPYRALIDRWLWPDLRKNEDVSFAKARKVISDYRRAVGLPEGLAELMVYYCERAAGFSDEFGLQDERPAEALVRMFAQALGAIRTLPSARRTKLLARLDAVRVTSRNFGYGAYEAMGELLADHRAAG